jgi:hypothetical protein
MRLDRYTLACAEGCGFVIPWRHGRRLNSLDEREELRVPVIVLHCYWRWFLTAQKAFPGILPGFPRDGAGRSLLISCY